MVLLYRLSFCLVSYTVSCPVTIQHDTQYSVSTHCSPNNVSFTLRKLHPYHFHFPFRIFFFPMRILETHTHKSMYVMYFTLTSNYSSTVMTDVISFCDGLICCSRLEQTTPPPLFLGWKYAVLWHIFIKERCFHLKQRESEREYEGKRVDIQPSFLQGLSHRVSVNTKAFH